MLLDLGVSIDLLYNQSRDVLFSYFRLGALHMSSFLRNKGPSICAGLAVFCFIWAFVCRAESCFLNAAILFSAAVIAAQLGDQEFHEKS